MRIDYKEAAQFIVECDNVLILTHASPDGDTLGSGFALCRALRNAGKKANVLCSDDFPERYAFMYKDCGPMDFEPQTVIAVDVADAKLLGEKLSVYADKVQLCIDHHISNTEYAERLLLGETSAAACEVIYRLLKEADMVIDDQTAVCLYTGIATDTGCFKFENVTKETHLIAAQFHDYDIPFAKLNRQLFDIRSKDRIKAEQLILSGFETECDGKCAVVILTLDLIEKAGIDPDEFDGIASVIMQVEGVEIGITVREKTKGVFKASVRSGSDADVSAMCRRFGGGGHIRAAGCTLEGTPEDVKKRLFAAAAEALANGA